MPLDKYKGYFYNGDGALIEFYIGYLDLDDMDGVLELRKNAEGFISHDAVDPIAYIYNFETEQIEEI